MRNFSQKIFILCLLIQLNSLPAVVVAQADEASFKSYEQAIPGTEIKFKMMPLNGDSYMMGSATVEKGREKDEGPAKEVSISPFWIGANEVTYDEYDAFFKDETFTRNEPAADAVTRPSPPYIDLTLGMGKQGGFPANSMSQYGALMYCRWLYEKTGVFYRLPTEAEWEYACRAGSTTAYPFGNDTTGLSDYAWYANNSEDKYHKTGLKKANKFGLYDIMGNVTEWTLDQYDEDYFNKAETSSENPVIKPTARHPRTLKGGNYRDAAVALRSASRLKSDPAWNRRDPQIPRSRWWNADAPFIGFRIVRPAVKPAKEEIDKFFARYLDNF